MYNISVLLICSQHHYPGTVAIVANSFGGESGGVTGLPFCMAFRYFSVLKARFES